MAKEINAENAFKSVYPESWERLQRVNNTADQLQSYWIGFLTICGFITASAMSVTHYDIFLDAPLHLPLVSVSVPLFWFFFASPLVIFSLHVFLLVKYRLLLGSLDALRTFEQTTEKTSIGVGHPSSIEEHFNASILMESLVSNGVITGDRRTEHRFAAFFGPMLTASITFLPILLFLVMQAKILPYQETTLDFLYRCLVGAEVLVVFWAFSEYWRKSGARLWIMILLAASAVSISSFSMVSDEGDIRAEFWADNWRPWTPILSPRNRDFVDDNQLETGNGRVTTILRGRSFVGASLEYADLRGVDMQKSDFRYAKLQSAKFDRAVLKEGQFDFANLEQASFTDAQMDGSTFIGANLRETVFSGADLREGDFHGANFERAYFDGTGLKNARLIGVNMRNARFIGANLKGAWLVGSYLGNANFKGAELKGVYLVGIVADGKSLLGLRGLPGDLIVERNNPPNFAAMDVIKKGHNIDLRGKSLKEQNSIYGGILIDDHHCLPQTVEGKRRLKEASKPAYEMQARLEFIARDRPPLLDLAGLKEVRVSQSSHVNGMSILVPGHLRPEECKARDCRIEKFDLLPSHSQSATFKSSDTYKLSQVGCRKQIEKRIGSEKVFKLVKHPLANGGNSSSCPPATRETVKNWRKLMCVGGSYPQVAVSILASGRLDCGQFSKLAQTLIDQRCTAACPGIKDLKRGSMSRLWRTAIKNRGIWRKELPDIHGSLPDVVNDCPSWEAFTQANPEL